MDKSDIEKMHQFAEIIVSKFTQISLRDEIAMRAMDAYMNNKQGTLKVADIAAAAYSIADSMLYARDAK